MKYLNILRWKLLLIIAVVFALVDYFALPWYFEKKLIADLEAQMKTTARVDKVELSLLAGKLVVEGLRVDDPVNSARWIFTADKMEFDLDVAALFKRKLEATRLLITNPKSSLERRADGSINVEPGSPTETPNPLDDPFGSYRRAKEMYEGYENARSWYDRIKTLMAKIRAKKEVEAENAEALAILRGRTHLPEVGPRFVMHELLIDGIEVDLRGDDGLPGLKAGRIEGEALNSDPLHYLIPSLLELSTKLDDVTGPALKLNAKFDGSSGVIVTQISGLLEKIDVRRLKSLIGDNLPVELLAGFVSLTWQGRFDGLRDMELRPVIVFEDLKMKPKDNMPEIAGFASSALTKEFSLAGTFALTDLRIYGDPLNPSFDTGNTMEKLMAMGGQAFAESIGKAMATELLGKIQGKFPGAEVLTALPDVMSGQFVPDLSKILGGGSKENSKGLLDGIIKMPKGQDGGADKSKKSDAYKIVNGLGNLIGGDDEKKKKKKSPESLINDLFGGKKKN